MNITINWNDLETIEISRSSISLTDQSGKEILISVHFHGLGRFLNTLETQRPDLVNEDLKNLMIPIVNIPFFPSLED